MLIIKPVLFFLTAAGGEATRSCRLVLSGALVSTGVPLRLSSGPNSFLEGFDYVVDVPGGAVASIVRDGLFFVAGDFQCSELVGRRWLDQFLGRCTKLGQQFGPRFSGAAYVCRQRADESEQQSF